MCVCACECLNTVKHTYTRLNQASVFAKRKVTDRETCFFFPPCVSAYKCVPERVFMYVSARSPRSETLRARAGDWGGVLIRTSSNLSMYICVCDTEGIQGNTQVSMRFCSYMLGHD